MIFVKNKISRDHHARSIERKSKMDSKGNKQKPGDSE